VSARPSRGGGGPVSGQRRGEARDAQLDGLELLVVLARLEGRQKRQIEGSGGELGVRVPRRRLKVGRRRRGG
jgi:hypothetical protein